MATEYILPDSDVANSIAEFGSGTAAWDRMNNGIDSDTPDESNGVYGLDGDYVDLGFANPAFSGTSTAIIVRIRAYNGGGSGDLTVTLYSDGSSSDGSFNPSPTGSYANYEQSFAVADTAANLTSLKVRILCNDASNDDWICECEVEITYTPPAVSINQINIGDVWKDVTEVKINVGDVWKDVNDGEINIGDVWKDMAS
jgi:hypothetical protein